MYEEHTVGVVIPAYNEEGFVGDVIGGVPSYVDRIYVVDDRSTDETWTEVLTVAEGTDDGGRGYDGSVTAVTDLRAIVDGRGDRAGAGGALASRVDLVEDVGRVVAIRHAENRGAGGAIKTGYLAALVDGVDVVATIDGDGQDDPAHLSWFLDPIVDGRAEYAKGSRFLTDPFGGEMPPFRTVGNTILTLLTRIASGYWRMSDPQNGYTAISSRALRKIDVEDMFEYYGYCNEVLVRLNAADVTIADVEVPATYGDEESDIEYSTYVVKVSRLLLEEFLWRIRTKYVDRGPHSIALLYAVGASLVGFAAVRAASALSGADERSASNSRRSAIALATVGILSLTAAMVTEWLESAHLVTDVESE